MSLRGRLLRLPLLLCALGAALLLWSLPPPPPPPPPPSPEADAAGSAMPPPRQVTRSLSELAEYVLGARRALSDHALLFTRMPHAGSEPLGLLLKWLQASNGFRLVPLPLAGEARSLSSAKQETVVTFVTETLRKEAVPVAFHGQIFFTNFSMFDRQSPAYISMVREPIDKAMSWLKHARGMSNRRGAKESSPLAKCVEESWPECTPRDVSIPYFCGQNPLCMEPDSTWALHRAKSNIEKYFPVVGVLENLNATFKVLETEIPLFFAGVQELYVNNLLDPHINWSSKRNKAWKPYLRDHLARHLWRETDFYFWIKQRLMLQLLTAQDKTPQPGEVGQKRLAYSVHKKFL